MEKQKELLWGIAFIIIFGLSQDYLFINWEGKPSFFGFPNWIGWFAFVHLLFISIFYWFAKKHWK